MQHFKMHFIGCYSQAEKEIKRLSIRKTILRLFFEIELVPSTSKFMTRSMRGYFYSPL